MSRAYDISYRDEIVETQGRLFGRLERENPGCDGVDFISGYLRSATRAALDHAEPIRANLFPGELKARFLGEDGYVFKPGDAVDGLSADWLGQFYAYYQWANGIDSRVLVDRLPVATMLAAYPGLHDLALPLAVERISNLQPNQRTTP